MPDKRRTEKTLYGAAIEALFGGTAPETITDFDNRTRGLSDNTNRLIVRVLDLVGPAGREAIEQLVVAVFDEAYDLGSQEVV